MTPGPKIGWNFFGDPLEPKTTREPFRIDFSLLGVFWGQSVKKNPNMDDFQILNFKVHFLSSHLS